jgi:large subunit ribosomal protein L29
MAKQKKELKNQSVEELETAAKELARELFLLRSELSMNRKLDKPHLLKAKRKDRARALTFLTQKKLSEKIVKGA